MTISLKFWYLDRHSVCSLDNRFFSVQESCQGTEQSFCYSVYKIREYVDEEFIKICHEQFITATYLLQQKIIINSPCMFRWKWALLERSRICNIMVFALQFCKLSVNNIQPGKVDFVFNMTFFFHPQKFHVYVQINPETWL